MIALVALLTLLLSSTLVAQTPDVVVDVRVHGNHATPDALELAGLTVGIPISEDEIEAAAGRLRDSGRFTAIEIRKRYASIADPSRRLLIVIVAERPGSSPDRLVPGPVGRMMAMTQWAPILSYEDGYGFTYGARLTRADGLGPGSRISMPLTWGGTRQIGVAAERRFDDTSIDRVTGSATLARRANPFYEIGDTRRGGTLGMESHLGSYVRLRAGGDAAGVSLGGIDDTFASLRTEAVVDTRLDPTFPRDAVFASASFERLAFRRQGPANRLTIDARSYVGLAGSVVLAVRAFESTSDRSLPPYEQALLGGVASVRGVRPGTAVGDSLVAGSAELRLPLTSPLEVGRLGLKAFLDTAATWTVSEQLRGRRFRVGAGGGVYVGVGPFMLTVDAARSDGRTRLHFGLGRGF